jgi:uncharacterized damage-inducible protein DinB
MSTVTLTEREGFLATFEREFQTTLKILKAFPSAQIGLKPGARSQAAGEIAWTLALNQHTAAPILAGELMPANLPPAPGTWNEIVAGFEQAHREALEVFRKMTDADMNGTVRMPVGKNKIADVRKGDAMWMMLYDTIHHRGQLSVYLRVAGANVPSIYGPSGDEPWY